MAYEEPRYTVIEKTDNIEIRQYDPYVVAQTVIESDFEQAGNQAHRILAAYISGENVSTESIEMTIPVSQEAIQPQSEKIEMTVPVNQEKVENGRYLISFVMPERYTIETLPMPKDDRVKLAQVPAKKVAVIRYSGTWSRENYGENESELLKYLEQNNHEIIGEPVWARYNPPFIPWFLRRNEIIVEIK